MVWKRYAVFKERLIENKGFLKQVAETSTKNRKRVLHGATISQLKILRDLIQKIYLKKKISIPKRIFKGYKKNLDYLALKLNGQKVYKRKELQKIFDHSIKVLPHLVKLILKNG